MKQKKHDPLLGLLLPSKGRLFDLVLTLFFTPLNPPEGLRVRFYIVANYNSIQLYCLKLLFSHCATFIDERSLDLRGVNGAYNYAFEEAKNNGAQWVALWADDLLPEKENWLFELNYVLSQDSFRLGIFSSDEGNHKGYYGWNIGAGYPCAHFYVACIDSLPGYVLNPLLKGFVGDTDIGISSVKNNIQIDLLPIKVIHQPTVNSTRASRESLLKHDVKQLYILHPELRGKLDGMILRGDLGDVNYRFVLDDGKCLKFSHEIKAVSFHQVISRANFTTLAFKIQFIYVLRKRWNRMMNFLRGAI